jgi:hypothetical protein
MNTDKEGPKTRMRVPAEINQIRVSSVFHPWLIILFQSLFALFVRQESQTDYESC